MYHKMGIKPCSMVWLYIHVYNCIWLLFCMLHCSIHILFHIFRGYFEIWIIWSQELFFFFFSKYEIRQCHFFLYFSNKLFPVFDPFWFCPDDFMDSRVKHVVRSLQTRLWIAISATLLIAFDDSFVWHWFRQL